VTASQFLLGHHVSRPLFIVKDRRACRLNASLM